MKKVLVIVALVLFSLSVMALAGDNNSIPVPDQLITTSDQLTPTIESKPDTEVSISDNGNGVEVKENVRDRVRELTDEKLQDVAIPADHQK